MCFSCNFQPEIELWRLAKIGVFWTTNVMCDIVNSVSKGKIDILLDASALVEIPSEPGDEFVAVHWCLPGMFRCAQGQCWPWILRE